LEKVAGLLEPTVERKDAVVESLHAATGLGSAAEYPVVVAGHYGAAESLGVVAEFDCLAGNVAGHSATGSLGVVPESDHPATENYGERLEVAAGGLDADFVGGLRIPAWKILGAVADQHEAKEGLVRGAVLLDEINPFAPRGEDHDEYRSHLHPFGASVFLDFFVCE
jgi:hypothetical protein